MHKVDRTVRNLSSSIIEPIDDYSGSVEDELSDAMKPPDVISNADFKSISLISPTSRYGLDDDYYNSQKRAFLLIDSDEVLCVRNVDKFCKQLQCSPDDKIKVVSIFGNTGDGKSHTMNNIFFNGDNVFHTSSEQSSCTIGVWAAMQLDMGVLCLDTEGLLGTTSNEDRRKRMLLKVLAISDIVIYRTRAARLHSDMIDFLGIASKAFTLHFAAALQSRVSKNSPTASSGLGPAVIIFHETADTKPLQSTISSSAEDIIRDNFAKKKMDIDAFSSLRYVGIQTVRRPTNYTQIRDAMWSEIKNTSVRSSRQPGVVFRAIEALNLKFSGDIQQPDNLFPEEYFTCTVTCESCGRRCQRSMGHIAERENHTNAKLCIYQCQYDNKVYYCKSCHSNGRQIIVNIRTQSNADSSWITGIAKYAWSGYVIECRNCGEIYRSRQHWYGNKPPEESAVRSETVHVWKGGDIMVSATKHSAQRVVDTVSYLRETITNIGAQPSKALTNWVADKIAPSYWRPNSEIKTCHMCNVNFETRGLQIHHCRACGEGFCDPCTMYEMAVPSRGWFQPVRVCGDCRDQLVKKQNSPDTGKNLVITEQSSPTGDNTMAIGKSEEGDVLVRKCGEAVFKTITSVASVLEYPKDLIKNSARPDYWVPDSEALACALCKTIFGTADELAALKTKTQSPAAAVTVSSKQQLINGDCMRHHCRACGQAVCDQCSKTRRPVPERAWLENVRVCDACADKSKQD